MMNGTNYGVRIAGVGSALPDGVLTNADFERMVDTSDEWIVKRTGIRERRIVKQGEQDTADLSSEALTKALDRASLLPTDLDLIIVGCCTQEMNCPSTACRVAAIIGARQIGAFDIMAACSGYTYSMNVADSLIRSGAFNTIGVAGCDVMSNVIDYDDRSLSILFGDGAGAAVLTRDPDPNRGCVYQTLGADGSQWHTLYIPKRAWDVPEDDKDNPIKLGCLRMEGREVYRFAVSKFREVIEDALRQTGLAVDDIAQFICHQSNARIIESAKQKIGLPDEKVLINIDRYGNCSAGSVGICVDELFSEGKIKEGDTIMIVAFGGGLTWSSCVWRV